MIEGFCETRDVYINNKRLNPIKSQNIVNHSPDGFAWGYAGSGPAQLALAILLEYTNEDTARLNYQKFKREFIATLKQGEDFEIDEKEVMKFINENIQREKEI